MKKCAGPSARGLSCRLYYMGESALFPYWMHLVKRRPPQHGPDSGNMAGQHGPGNAPGAAQERQERLFLGGAGGAPNPGNMAAGLGDKDKAEEPIYGLARAQQPGAGAPLSVTD